MDDFAQWLANISQGWNDFWSNIGDKAQEAFDNAESANWAIASANTPGSLNDFSEGAANSILHTSQPGSSANGFETSDIDMALEGSPSLSSYIQENPNLSAEDYLKFMSQHSDEWAEKWMDYVLEKQSIDEQNAYTASREDTAYQRLVQDLKNAGLNPAMMYGSSASASAGGSVGVVRASEGSNSRSVSNYNKIKNLLLSYMVLQLKGMSTSANSIMSGLSMILNYI